MSSYKTQNKESQSAITPDEVISMLREGNERFVNKGSLERDHIEQVTITSKGQFPFAIIHGCIDSRVPVEHIFDLGLGDVFTSRIAGNIINEDILGSMEFACAAAGAKAIIIVGHTKCGAIRGACDHVKLGNLTGLLKKIEPVIDSLKDKYEDLSSANDAFFNDVIKENVYHSVNLIRQKSSILSTLEQENKIKIVGALYNVDNGSVTFLP
ncbi:MAG: carbonic anhydrase family protein [Cyclobacteriaceae bacterium]|nr:carbonic anhydrase family protein [Cyclobacteriaceae bacterium]